jgi:hypothetical protein
MSPSRFEDEPDAPAVAHEAVGAAVGEPPSAGAGDARR